MGYTTEFGGSFDVTPALTDEMRDYLNGFAMTRRMARDPEAVKARDPHWVEHCLHGDLGPEAGLYVPVDDLANYGQSRDASVIDYNRPPEGQPGLWCQWVPGDDGCSIVWDEGEKFYNYVDWLVYLIDHILAPDGYVISGKVAWRGEDFDDMGVITVDGNHVSTTMLDY